MSQSSEQAPEQAPKSGKASIGRLGDLATLVSLCKRRGFVFQSSEIYGGLGSCWDYGPLGANLKLNVKLAWWKAMTRRERLFNLMFKTFMGPTEDAASVIYLRPETAQGHFVNFENIQSSSRKKIPFGIAAIGKSFRNEITPGNFIFRTREFEQMEMQYFVKPGTDLEWWEKWRETRWSFLKGLGIKEENLRFHEHAKDELAHYALKAGDIQYKFPFGWQELEGIHNRSDFDLTQHAKFSGKKLEYFDEASKDRFVPFVIETAVGCDRLVLTVMCDAYREEITPDEETGKPDIRVVLGFHPSLAPMKVAILPLSKKAELQGPAMQLRSELSEEFDVAYDDSQSIGKRYRRQDEVGTPFCVTYDFESLNDKKVTVRHRDTMKQDRVDLTQVADYIRTGLKNFNKM
jgi:glycyl-tRNA synthetase